MAGNGFQGQSEGMLHFGLGEATEVQELSIQWPSGLKERFVDLPANHLMRIMEREGQVSTRRLRGWRPAKPTTVGSKQRH
ncbi:MAG: ASPIC/UnbV domain-containing protein [Nitrososphaera sp.]